MKNGVLCLLLAGLALVAGLLATDGFGSTPGAPRPSGASGRDAAVLARILERLDGLTAAVARLERAEIAPAVPLATGCEGVRLRDDLADVSAALEELRRTIAGRPVTAPAVRDLASLHRVRAETDWLACDQLVSAWRSDPGKARESVRFLSPAELLEQLGAPTRVRGEEEGEVRWIYGVGPDAPRDYRIDLSLFDGYVTALHVRD